MAFIEAVRTQRKLRLAVCGVSGSGKSTTAMRLAQRLAKRIADREGREPRVAVIDTENGSMSLLVNKSYDGVKFKFKTSQLKDFSPTAYANEIKASGRAGFDALIVDSLSHAWAGKGGALELKDKVSEASSSGNSFTAWRTVTPMHNDLVETILQSSCHIFVTMRSHQEYVQDKDDRGKTVVRKIGRKPVQREGMEYEFDIFLDIDENHLAKVSKTRCDLIDGMTVMKPGAEFMDLIAEWLETGDDIPQEVIDAAKLMEAKPSVVKPLSSGNVADKPETSDERLARLKAEKAAKTASTPLVSNQPATTATSTVKPLSGKPATKPLQATPAATTVKPAEAVKPVEKPAEQPTEQSAEILTREEDSAAEACDATAPAEPLIPITDADMPPDAPPHPFILANADATKPATSRQCAVILAMYAAMELTPEVIESACRNRSPSNETTVYDVCEEGAMDMINKARKKMLKDDPDWAKWLGKINKEYAKQVDAMAEVPF